jgi:hypothetical protein
VANAFGVWRHEPELRRQLGHDAAQSRHLLRGDDARVIRPQDEPVAEEVRNEVQYEREAEGEDEPGQERPEQVVADEPADDDEQGDDRPEEERGPSGGTHRSAGPLALYESASL